MQVKHKIQSLISALIIIVLTMEMVNAVFDSINIDVIDTRDLKLNFVRIDNPLYFNTTISDSIDFIRRTYPLSDDGVIYEGSNFDINSLINGSGCASSITASEICLIGLHIKVEANVFLSGKFPERILAVVPFNWFSDRLDWSITGHARPPFKSVIIEEEYRALAAHELGHTYNFCEENSRSQWSAQDSFFKILSLGQEGCQNGDANPQDNQLDDSCVDEFTGCDTSTIGKLLPWNNSNNFIKLFNFMGAIDTAQDERWISKDSYSHLLEEFSHSTPENSSSRILISGIFNRTSGNYELNNFYVLEEGLVENRSDFEKGNFSIALLNISSAVLYNLSFNLAFGKFYENETEIESNISGFVFVIPFNESLNKIRFKENNILKDEVNRTANTPRINITSNMSGKLFIVGEAFNITWNATDADNDTLAYAILFSSDNGNNYTTLEIDYNYTNITLNSSNLQKCDLCKIKILVTDGINTNSSLSDAFAIKIRKIVDLTQGNISQDGHIKKDSYGTYSRDSASSTMKIGFDAVDTYRGYIDFNTSSIPATADVEDVDLNLTFTSLGSKNCDINQLEKKPSSATDQHLYNDIGNGTSYINNNNFCVTGSSYYPSLDLGDNANTDLENLLSAKWFGVGIKWDVEYPYSGTLAYPYSSESTNDPILIVRYTG